jgi:hypothetical protein
VQHNSGGERLSVAGAVPGGIEGGGHLGVGVVVEEPVEQGEGCGVGLVELPGWGCWRSLKIAFCDHR